MRKMRVTRKLATTWARDFTEILNNYNVTNFASSEVSEARPSGRASRTRSSPVRNGPCTLELGKIAISQAWHQPHAMALVVVHSDNLPAILDLFPYDAVTSFSRLEKMRCDLLRGFKRQAITKL